MQLLNYIAAYKEFYGTYPKRIKLPDNSILKPGKIFVAKNAENLPVIDQFLFHETSTSVTMDDPITITLY